MLALRIDDIGASSKRFEVYSKKWKGLGNILFLKYLPYFKAWGPYKEMSAQEWNDLLLLLKSHQACLTVAITAAWVEKDATLTPFPEKFPEQAKVIARGLEEKVLDIAIHGLTHCITQEKKFLPKLYRGNREFHREFRPEMPYEWHYQNLKQAKSILETYFKRPMDLLVPPGNLFGEHTLKACQELGIKIINCKTQDNTKSDPRLISNQHVLDFHDKELVEEGLAWLEKKIVKAKKENQGPFVFVRDLP